MKENNKKEILSRRDFFKRGISKTIPFLVCASIPSILTSCSPEDDEPFGGDSFCNECSNSCEGSCYTTCSTTCEGNSQSSSCSGCSNSCSGDCAESCGNSCGNNCSSSCKNSSSSSGNEDDDSVSSASGSIDGYEYVDLGLSVKWARYNIGASSPEKYGTYHIFASPSNSTTNLYDNLINAGFFGDDKSICGSQFDTATSKWGNKWQMPSKEHFKELIQSCKQEVITYKNVKGILFTSNKNNKTIFFPFAGSYWRYDGWEKMGEGSKGEYWTGFLSCCRASLQDALYIQMNQNGVEYKESRTADIYENKCSIRPVTSNGNNSNPNNCQNSCTATCANNSTGSGCSSCGSNCSSSCGSNCSGACVNTCSTGCGKQCRYSCGGGCSQTCAGFCSGGCKGASKGSCSDCTGSCSYLCSKSCSQYCYSSCTNMGVKSL